MTVQNNRYLLYDLIKIILSFLVVNLHIESFVVHAPFTPLYFLGWYAVPIFVTLSFFLSSKNYLSQTFSQTAFFRKISRFIIPFIFWSLIGFLIHPNLISVKYVLRQLFMGTAVDPPLYYLSSLAIVSVFIYYTRKYILFKQKVLSLAILFILIMETSGLEQSLATFLPIQIQLASMRIFEFLKYALLGISLTQLINYLSIKTSKWFILWTTILLISLDIWHKWNHQISDLSYGGVVQFTIIMMIMNSLIMFKDINLGNTTKIIISKIGSYSLGIYCVHTFFLERIIGYSNSLVLSFIVFLLSLLSSFIIDKVSLGRLKSVVS